MPQRKTRPPKKGKGAKKEKESKKKAEAKAEPTIDVVAAAGAAASASVAAGELSDEQRMARMNIITTFAQNARGVHRNTRDINVSNVTMLFHGRPIIEETDIVINYGNRYGLIGRNGAGKSTLLNMLSCRGIPIPDSIDLFHLSEEIEASDMTALEAVITIDKERQVLEAEADALNDVMTTEGISDEEAEAVMDRLQQVYDRLDEMDASTAEVRASRILHGLGFTPAMQAKKTKDFSGGWRMRISLARALFLQPTMLILDEPTNHLDMEAVVWLEDYLGSWSKILLMICHSQDFMNSVCTHIVHLTQKKLKYYTGNYDSYVQTRKEVEEHQMKRYNWEQEEIRKMKEYIARFGHGTAKLARQAQSKEKALAKMMRSGLTEKPQVERKLKFRFPDPGAIPPPVMQVNNVSFAYPGCAPLYDNLEFGVDLDSRIALVGPNGAGKSTLLKLLNQELQPTDGVIRPHSHLRISKFTQHFEDMLKLEMEPLEYMQHLYQNATRDEMRSWLGRFGVTGSEQTTVMEHLSDGQKARVVFAKIAKDAPHMLFLDEPTNHLDIESIDSLADAINEYKGGVVLVSHDMRLIQQVTKEIWIVDHGVERYRGDISSFKMELRSKMNVESAMSRPDGSVPISQPDASVPLAPAKTVRAEETLEVPTEDEPEDFPALAAAGEDAEGAAEDGDAAAGEDGEQGAPAENGTKYVPPHMRA